MPLEEIDAIIHSYITASSESSKQSPKHRWQRIYSATRTAAIVQTREGDRRDLSDLRLRKTDVTDMSRRKVCGMDQRDVEIAEKGTASAMAGI